MRPRVVRVLNFGWRALICGAEEALGKLKEIGRWFGGFIGRLEGDMTAYRAEV